MTFIEKTMYGCIGFLLGAYLITGVSFKVKKEDIDKHNKLCKDDAIYYSVRYTGQIRYVYCENMVKKIKVLEPK